MKKFILPLMAVGFIFAGTSCKKDYTCTCTYDGGSYTYVMTESKKAAAYANCEGKGIGTVTVDGVAVPEDTSTSCAIQ